MIEDTTQNAGSAKYMTYIHFFLIFFPQIFYFPIFLQVFVHFTNGQKRQILKNKHYFSCLALEIRGLKMFRGYLTKEKEVGFSFDLKKSALIWALHITAVPVPV